MDRTQAFVEYGRILQDIEDSFTGGFRRPGKELDVHPPIPGTAESVSTEPRQDGIPSPAGRLTTAAGRPTTGIPPESAAEGRTMPGAGGINAPPAGAPSPDIPATSATPVPGFSAIPSSTVPPAGEDRPMAPATEAQVMRPPVNPESVQELNTIAGEVGECRGCNLYLLRENTVPGIGNPGATLMVVTSPPTDSASEHSTPLPAYEQEYLEKWLRALGLDPTLDVFITPSVKCRTPGNRPPKPEEAAACTSFLRRQYKAVAPKAVLALGSSGCGALTGNPGDFPSLVGKDWTWGAVPALVLWTPAEVLANPSRLRGPVWDALQRLKVAWNAIPGSQL